MNVLAFITPALFTSRLTSAHRSATRATPSGSVMSRATGVTPASVTAAGSRAAPYTLAAPRLTSSAANTRPRPRPAPVTRATDPAIFIKPPRGWIYRGNQNRGVAAISSKDVVAVGWVLARTGYRVLILRWNGRLVSWS